MSHQRAIVNCERCYAIASNYLKGIDDAAIKEKGIRLEMFRDDRLYAARNEAMRALERQVSEFGDSKFISKTSLKCLSSCMKCDYSQPNIVISFKNQQDFDNEPKNEE